MSWTATDYADERIPKCSEIFLSTFSWNNRILGKYTFLRNIHFSDKSWSRNILVAIMRYWWPILSPTYLNFHQYQITNMTILTWQWCVTVKPFFDTVKNENWVELGGIEIHLNFHVRRGFQKLLRFQKISLIPTKPYWFTWKSKFSKNQKFQIFHSLVQSLDLDLESGIRGSTSPNCSEIFKCLLALVRSEVWFFSVLVRSGPKDRLISVRIPLH